MVSSALPRTTVPQRNRVLGAATRLWDLAGIAGPVALALVIALVSSRRPEYSNLIDTLSELGRKGTPHAKWMNVAGFLLCGVLTAMAARSVYSAFGSGALSTAGAALVAFGGLFLVGLGVFPMDEHLPLEARELRTQAHVFCAFMVFLCFTLSPLLFGLHALRRPALRFWAGFSLCAFLGAFGFGLPFFSADAEYRGACQRASMAAHYSWLAAVCMWRFVRGEKH
jgi:hypothetical membrane protein